MFTLDCGLWIYTELPCALPAVRPEGAPLAYVVHSAPSPQQKLGDNSPGYAIDGMCMSEPFALRAMMLSLVLILWKRRCAAVELVPATFYCNPTSKLHFQAWCASTYK